MGQAKVEIRFRHFVTGEPIWTLFSAFAVSDASGELVALATVSRDVTEERRARLALAESEARLAAELAVMKRLQELSTRLVKHGDGAGLLPEIVDAAIGITAADMGDVRLYDRASDSLRIVASRGFRPEDLEPFAVIRRGESTCGTGPRAAGAGWSGTSPPARSSPASPSWARSSRPASGRSSRPP